MCFTLGDILFLNTSSLRGE